MTLRTRLKSLRGRISRFTTFVMVRSVSRGVRMRSRSRFRLKSGTLSTLRGLPFLSIRVRLPRTRRLIARVVRLLWITLRKPRIFLVVSLLLPRSSIATCRRSLFIVRARWIRRIIITLVVRLRLVILRSIFTKRLMILFLVLRRYFILGAVSTLTKCLGLLWTKGYFPFSFR